MNGKLYEEFNYMKTIRNLILNYLISTKIKLLLHNKSTKAINECIREIISEKKLINIINKAIKYNSLNEEVLELIKLIKEKNDYICVLIYNNELDKDIKIYNEKINTISLKLNN